MASVQQHTKIVATLGPATDRPEVIAALIDAGLDVARINGSHGDEATQSRWIAMVREASARAGRAVGILYDLQGPKIRVGRFAGPPRPVRAGEELVFAVRRPAEPDELPTDYDALDTDVRPGEPLLINDGQIIAEIISVSPGSVRFRAQNDGEIAQRKGINLPKSAVSAPAISERDRDAALFAARQGVDFIAISFVRRAEDVKELKTLLAQAGFEVPVIAKIEKPQALTELEAILAESYGVMVARGDLGVELSPEDVPMAQKQIIHHANRMGRPVITATQMLDSMTYNPRPTRAEASDVANAVLDGTDAVMLSGETAVGKYPVETVAMMGRIIQATERGTPHNPLARRRERHVDSVPEAVADACCQVAHHLNAKLIAVFTQTGSTAVQISERRPATAVVAFTPSPVVHRRLSVVWGVRPHLLEPSHTLEERSEHLDKALLDTGLGKAGDLVVISMGAPMAPPGSTNLLMVHRVGMGFLK